jgi:hypothetical protein
VRLSEAIRLGSMLKPQGFGGTDTPDASCAVRAACDAIGGDAEMPYTTVAARFGVAAKLPAACPECDRKDFFEGFGTGLWVVYHLNDRHRWTRERIADWVETIEAQHEPQSASTPVGVERAK